MDVQAILTVLGTPEAEPSLYQRREINLSETDISGANLVENHYEYVDFREANLNQAHLNGAFFNRAYFNGTNLSEADLQGATLEGANLSGANLETAKNLDQKQIDSAIGDSYTKLPSNLHMPKSWKEGH